MHSGRDYLKNNVIKIKEKLNNNKEVAWDDEYLNDWKSKAEEKQQFYLESLGGRSWEEYKSDEEEFLRLKIGFAIYGPSADVDGGSTDEPVINFKDPEQKKTIDLITETIYKISESNIVYTAFIFVIAFLNNEYAEYPVVRVLNRNSKSIFFTDMLGRAYKDWNDFTSNHTFPCCICCYPKNGFYSCSKDGKVELCFGYSPENSKLKRFLRKVDTVSGVAGAGSAAIGMAGLAVPLSGPVVLGSAAAGLASALWSTCRTVTTLRDRKKHFQTLSVSDRNARACWITLAAGIIGGASAGAMQYTEFISRTGLALNRIPCLAVSTLEIGNIGIGGLSIINHIVSIVQKKECTLLDSVQVILSILFFFHASVSFITAKAIMRNINRKIVDNAEIHLNVEQQNELIMQFQENWKNCLVEGNVEDIRTLRTIGNEETFFQKFLGIRNKPNGSTKDGHTVVLDEKNICTPDIYLQNMVEQAPLMNPSIKLLSENELKLVEDINNFSKQDNLFLIKNEISRKLYIESIDFCTDSKQLMATASSQEIYILHKTVEAIENNPKSNNGFEKVVMEIKKLVGSISCKNVQEFILLIQSILQKYEEYKLAYEAVKKIVEQVKLIKLKTSLKKKGAEKDDTSAQIIRLDDRPSSAEE